MSLSQKHVGKVLVPWFNIAEWKHVYNLIYTEHEKDWSRALSILKIWKHRTPLLSAGVEGTLIVLEALLINSNQLSSYEVSHIFSTSVVRFLNLCAANNDKQGTFYKTAMQNELPKWIISLRHDIAHSHKVPSLSMLETSLKFCLAWLQEKYWDAQNNDIKDFIPEDTENNVVDDAIYIYRYLEISKGVKNRDLRRRLRRYLEGDRSRMRDAEIIEQINKKLRDEINRKKIPSCDKICTLLFDNLAFFAFEFETDKPGQKQIPTEILSKWTTLINMLNDTETLLYFVTKLFQFVCDETRCISHREAASLWLKEIFIGLINREQNKKADNSLTIHKLNKSMKDKEFALKVMETITPFSFNFIAKVLQYNELPEEFVNDFLPLISAFQAKTTPKSHKIFTVADLNLEKSQNGIDEAAPNSRWIQIEETAPYLNLPLGILPHQDRNINPLLAV